MEKCSKKRVSHLLAAMCFLVMFFSYVTPQTVHAEADFIKVAAYEMELENMKGDLSPKGEYILMAKDLYFKTFTKEDTPETRDAAFEVFFKFYSNIAENSYKDEAFANLPFEGPEVEEAKKIAAKYGLQLRSVEGTYEPIADPRQIFKMFESHLSDAYKAYLILSNKTVNLVEDAALTVGYDDLRKIIIFGDTILQRYPKSVVVPLVQKNLKNVLELYFTGMDNTPVYDRGNTKLILPEVKSSYEAFLKENKSSTYYPLVKEMYDFLKKNHFTYTDSFRTKLYKKLREKGLL